MAADEIWLGCEQFTLDASLITVWCHSSCISILVRASLQHNAGLMSIDTSPTPRRVNLPVFRSVAMFSLLYDRYNSQLLPTRDTVITIVNYVIIIIIIITSLCFVTFINATATSGTLCRSEGLKNFRIAHAHLCVLPTVQLLIKKYFTFL